MVDIMLSFCALNCADDSGAAVLVLFLITASEVNATAGLIL